MRLLRGQKGLYSILDKCDWSMGSIRIIIFSLHGGLRITAQLVPPSLKMVSFTTGLQFEGTPVER